MSLDIWTSRVTVPGQLDVRVPPASLPVLKSVLRKLKIDFSILHSNLQDTIEQERTLNHQIQQTDNSGFFNSYANYTQMMTFLTELNAQFPTITNLVLVGTTIEGRNITGIVISGNRTNTNKPAIVLNGCQHAREWISPMTVAYIAQALCTNYTTDTDVKQMVDYFEFTVIPIVNADGYVYTQTDRMWRKNRRTNKNSQCIGVDINRNWNYEWATVGSSPLACSDTYQGPSGFSEPEETSVANYISSKNGRVQGYVDYHSYGELWMSPWGWTKALPADDPILEAGSKQITTSINKVHNQKFKYGPVYTTIYPASGGSNDWTYGAGKVVYSYACELRGNSFILPPDQIIPSGQESWAGVKTMADFIIQNPPKSS